MNKKTRTILNTLLFLGLGIGLFIWTVKKAGATQLIDDISEARLEYILLAMACGIFSHLLRAMRWNLLLEPMGYKARLWGSFHAVILGYMVNLVVPRLGEVTRPAALSKLENIPFNKLVGTVLIERVIDLIITLLIAGVIILIQFTTLSDFLRTFLDQMNLDSLWFYAGAAILFIGLLVTLFRLRFRIYQLPFFQKLKGFIEGMIEGLKSVFKLKRKLLFITYSLLIWVMYFFMPYFVLFALPGTSHLGVEAGLTVLLFGTIAMIIPVPGGIGTFHVLVPAALSLYGIDKVITGNSYAVLTHAIQVMVILSVGIISVIYFAYHAQMRKKNGMAQSD